MAVWLHIETSLETTLLNQDLITKPSFSLKKSWFKQSCFQLLTTWLLLVPIVFSGQVVKSGNYSHEGNDVLTILLETRPLMS